MNFINYLDEVARDFCKIIAAQPNSETVPTKDYGWENHRWTSPQFRMAHVEIFNQDRFMVVHCCVFPHVTDPAPIFGLPLVCAIFRLHYVLFVPIFRLSSVCTNIQITPS